MFLEPCDTCRAATWCRHQSWRAARPGTEAQERLTAEGTGVPVVPRGSRRPRSLPWAPPAPARLPGPTLAASRLSHASSRLTPALGSRPSASAPVAFSRRFPLCTCPRSCFPEPPRFPCPRRASGLFRVSSARKGRQRQARGSFFGVPGKNLTAWLPPSPGRLRSCCSHRAPRRPSLLLLGLVHSPASLPVPSHTPTSPLL